MAVWVFIAKDKTMTFYTTHPLTQIPIIFTQLKNTQPAQRSQYNQKHSYLVLFSFLSYYFDNFKVFLRRVCENWNLIVYESAFVGV